MEALAGADLMVELHVAAIGVVGGPMVVALLDGVRVVALVDVLLLMIAVLFVVGLLVVV